MGSGYLASADARSSKFSERSWEPRFLYEKKSQFLNMNYYKKLKTFWVNNLCEQAKEGSYFMTASF